VDVDYLHEKHDCTVIITRSLFEILCKPYFLQCIQLIDKLMKNSGLRKVDIDDVVLVGGSSRIPKLVQMISEYFSNKEIKKSLNADEAVAYGAAIQGALLTGQSALGLCFYSTTISLGIATQGGLMTAIVPRNTTLPARGQATFTTSKDNQKQLVVQIYEGESVLVSDNRLLYEFPVDLAQVEKGGISQVEVVFDIDGHGMLFVSANDKRTGQGKMVPVTLSQKVSFKKDNKSSFNLPTNFCKPI